MFSLIFGRISKGPIFISHILLDSLTGKRSRVSISQTKSITNFKSYLAPMAFRLCFVFVVVVFYSFLHLVMNSLEIICYVISLNAQATNTRNTHKIHYSWRFLLIYYLKRAQLSNYILKPVVSKLYLHVIKPSHLFGLFSAKLLKRFLKLWFITLVWPFVWGVVYIFSLKLCQKWLMNLVS
jgi:hypothetical protein